MNVGTSDNEVGTSDMDMGASDNGPLPPRPRPWTPFCESMEDNSVRMRLDLSYITKQKQLNAKKTQRSTAMMGPGLAQVDPVETWGCDSRSLTVCNYSWCHMLGARFLVLQGMTEMLRTG